MNEHDYEMAVIELLEGEGAGLAEHARPHGGRMRRAPQGGFSFGIIRP